MTFQKIIVVLLSFSLLIPTLVQPTTVYSQPQDRVQSTRQATGRTTNTYREVQSADAQAAPQSRQRPAWVENALERSFAFLNARDKNPPAQAERVRPEAQDRFVLQRADQDDLGLTHVRLNQVHRGVPVFGRQIITHLDANGIRSTSGATLDSVDEIEAHPIISAEYAVNVAKAKLGYGGNFAREPEVKLVVLPNEFFKEADKTGATLVYQVELQLMDGTAMMGHHRYFVDAATREIVWYYNALPNDTGRSLYRGTVNIAGKVVPKVQGYPAQISYENSLIDTSRGGLYVFTYDVAHDYDVPPPPVKHVGTGSALYSWGDGTTAHPETVAVDAYWSAARAWDYFQERHQRNGADGKGGQISLGVHFSDQYNNAHATSDTLIFGDGDGVTYNPFVSLDVVGHEFTHLVIANTAGFIHEKESGSLSESFADIFGTAIEFYATNNSGNYLIGEQVTKNGQGGRSMSNPAAFGDPDHYSKRVKSFDCGYGGCDIHSNAGIPNKAFHFLAEGGSYQGTTLAGIGRIKAEKIFYRALTTYLYPNAKFADARSATLKAAADLYGPGSVEQKAVATAWSSVGVSCTVILWQDSIGAAHVGGTGSFQVYPAGECAWNAVSEVPWIKVISGSGTANGLVTFSIDANLGEARYGTINISGRTLTIYQQASQCAPTPIESGQTLNRQLTSWQQCEVLVGEDLRRGERFSFYGQAGKSVAFAMNSATMDSYLKLIGPDGKVLATSDDVPGGLNARFPATGYFTLPVTGNYLVEATTSPKAAVQTGSYTLSYLVGCQYQLLPANATIGNAGGTGSFVVTVSGGCPLTAVSNALPWLEITGQTAISSSAVRVNYKVLANTTNASRTGTITVGTQTFTVTQTER